MLDIDCYDTRNCTGKCDECPFNEDDIDIEQFDSFDEYLDAVSEKLNKESKND